MARNLILIFTAITGIIPLLLFAHWGLIVYAILATAMYYQFIHKRKAFINQTTARPLSENHPELYNYLLENITSHFLFKPDIYEYESSEINAVAVSFAVPRIMLSSESTKALTKEELKAVTFHEAAHIQRKHFLIISFVRIIRQSLLVFVLLTFMFQSRMITIRALDGLTPWIPFVLFVIFLSVNFLYYRLWALFEIEADSIALNVLEQSGDLISALKKSRDIKSESGFTEKLNRTRIHIHL